MALKNTHQNGAASVYGSAKMLYHRTIQPDDPYLKRDTDPCLYGDPM